MYLFRNILRIAVLLFSLSLAFFFILDGCGGMSEEDEVDFRRERSDRDRDRDEDQGRGRRGNDDEGLAAEDDEDGGGFLDFRKSGLDDDEEKSAGVNQIIEPLEQGTLSEKIDFLFVIDTSRSNRKYITKPVIQKKLGTFISRLNEEDIDWRIFTTCGHTDKDEPLYNGRLHEMEHNKTLINFLYLDNHILDSYNARNPTTFTSEVFIDTISHPKRTNCKRPPFCYKDKENRPLKAISGFLDTAYRHQILRDDNADLVIIIISNQDERPSPIKPKTPYDPRNIVDQFENNFPDKNLFVVNFVIKSTDENCKKGKTASYIPQLGILTNGLTESICSNNYTQTLIKFIREKQGKTATTRRRTLPSRQRIQTPENLRNDIYGENLNLR